MRRRITGIVAALVLASIGTLLLVAYVQAAKNEAVAAERLVPVIVVTEPVAKGQALSDGNSQVVEVPAKVRPADSLESLADVEGLVAAVPLVPGEQALASRFVSAQAAQSNVPPGKLETTVALEPQRAVGGSLRAGDHVGVVLSFPPFEASVAGRPEGSLKTPNITHLALHRVLVTGVQVERKIPDPEDDPEAEGQPTLAPTGKLLVTLALGPDEVEQVVFAAEFGTVWLASQSPEASEAPTDPVTWDKALR